MCVSEFGAPFGSFCIQDYDILETISGPLFAEGTTFFQVPGGTLKRKDFFKLKPWTQS